MSHLTVQKMRLTHLGLPLPLREQYPVGAVVKRYTELPVELACSKRKSNVMKIMGGPQSVAVKRLPFGLRGYRR